MMKRSVLTAMILGIVVIAGCDTSDKQTGYEPEFVLTYAENQVEDYPTTKGAKYFAELVENRTHGKVVIQVKYDGEFGTQQQVITQMKFGGIDFARVSLSSLSNQLPQLNVLQLPYLYEDGDHMWKVLDSDIGDMFKESFYDLDLIPLSWYEAGARSFYSATKVIDEVEDMHGMIIRVQNSELMEDMIRNLGGIPVDLAYGDVFSALEIGEIDAAENNWPSYNSTNHCEVAGYYTLDEHTRVPEIQLASRKTWDKLPEEYQQIILECAEESAEYEKELWKEEEKISREQALSKGAVEIKLSEEELQKFREAVEPLYEEYCLEYMDIVDRIRLFSEK